MATNWRQEVGPLGEIGGGLFGETDLRRDRGERGGRGGFETGLAGLGGSGLLAEFLNFGLDLLVVFGAGIEELEDGPELIKGAGVVLFEFHDSESLDDSFQFSSIVSHTQSDAALFYHIHFNILQNIEIWDCCRMPILASSPTQLSRIFDEKW